MNRPQMREMKSRRRGRLILFWFTVVLIVVVAVIAVVTIIRLFRGSPSRGGQLVVGPADAILCPGQVQPYTADGESVTWSATGGAIGADGAYTAGETAGDYQVSAVQEETGQSGQAAVHILECTPTPPPAATAEPPPTAAPPTPEPTGEPEPVMPAEDPRGDVRSYDTAEAVDGVAGGVDIQTGSVGADQRVVLQSEAGAPSALAGWPDPGEALAWLVLYEPIPEKPPAYTDWVFALDLDGNPQTGRPPGQARVNPGLGDEAVLGLAYDATSEEFSAYLLVWSTADQDWVSGPDQVRYFIDEGRTVVGLAVPLQTLVDAVANASGVSVLPGSVKGRFGVLSYVGDQAVIDLYPDAP